jgi:hypothetical protein
VVGAFDGADRVDLNEAQALDQPAHPRRGRGGSGGRVVEEGLRVEEQPARVGRRDDERRSGWSRPRHEGGMVVAG